MQPILAMAGLAEAAEFYALLIVAGALAIDFGLIIFCLSKRSPIAGMLACILCFLTGLVLQPWMAFRSPSSDDPDEAYWLVRGGVAILGLFLWLFLFLLGFL